MIDVRSSYGPEPRISVVIVHRGDSDAVYASVESVAGFSDLDFPLEIILVENGVYELVRPRVGPGVLRVRMPGGDRGYAAAANEGSACARAPYLLFLEPQAYVSRDDVATLVRVARNDGRLAGVAPVLMPVDESGRTLSRRSWMRRVRTVLAAGRANARLSVDTQRFVRWAPAVSLLVRADVFRALGGFDEAFVDSGADEDWCRRARARGYQIALLPGVRVRVGRRPPARSGAQPEERAGARLRIVARHSGPLTVSLYRCATSAYLALGALLDHAPGRGLLSTVKVRARGVPRTFGARSTKPASAGS